MLKKSALLIVAIILLAQSPAWAATFYVDAANSKVLFNIKYLTGAANGSFKKFGGAIDLNEKNTALTGLAGALDIRSISTDNQDRDNELRSEKYFLLNFYGSMFHPDLEIKALLNHPQPLIYFQPN